MKKTVIVMSAIAMTMVWTSCKSQKTLTEAAVVADPAVEQKAAEVKEVPAVTYSRPQRPAPVVQPGDRSEKVTVVNDAEAALLKDYNIVVGSFGSATNAEAYKLTMQQRGYRAFLVRNEQGFYRVVAGSYDTREEAQPVRDQIRSTYSSEKDTAADAWLLIPKQ